MISKRILRVEALCLAIAASLASTSVASQQMSNATRNQITAEYLSADDDFSAKKYADAWAKLEKIRQLNPGDPIPTAQDLRVRVLIAQQRWEEAEVELRRLRNLNLSGNTTILRALSGYDTRISASLAEARQTRLAQERAYAAINPYLVGQNYANRVRTNQQALISSKFDRRFSGDFSWGIGLWRETISSIRLRPSPSNRTNQREIFRAKVEFLSTMKSVDRSGRKRPTRTNWKSSNTIPLSTLSLHYQQNGQIVIQGRSRVDPANSSYLIFLEYGSPQNRGYMDNARRRVATWAATMGNASFVVPWNAAEKEAQAKNATDFARGVREAL